MCAGHMPGPVAQVLKERNFPYSSIKMLASARCPEGAQEADGGSMAAGVRVCAGAGSGGHGIEHRAIRRARC